MNDRIDVASQMLAALVQTHPSIEEGVLVPQVTEPIVFDNGGDQHCLTPSIILYAWAAVDSDEAPIVEVALSSAVACKYDSLFNWEGESRGTIRRHGIRAELTVDHDLPHGVIEFRSGSNDTPSSRTAVARIANINVNDVVAFWKTAGLLKSSRSGKR